MFDVNEKHHYSRQLGLHETFSTDIAGYEALGLEFAILNVDLTKNPTHIKYEFFIITSFLKTSLRVFCDNMIVVTSFSDLRGARHPVVK